MTPITPEWAKTNLLGIAIAVFFFLIIAEMFWNRHRNRTTYEFRDTAASMLVGFVSLFTGALTAGINLVISLGVYDLRLFNIGWTWEAMIVCFFVTDLTYYISHRISHERRFF